MHVTAAQQSANEVNSIAASEHGWVELVKPLIELRLIENQWEIEQPVEAETVVGRTPFERERPGCIGRSETHSPLLQQVSTSPTDGDVLRVTTFKIRRGGNIEQTLGAKREAAVSHITMAPKLRPGSADIVVFEERRCPCIGINDETVPLNHEHVRSIDVTGKVAKHEPGIFFAAPNRLDPRDTNQRMSRVDRLVGKKFGCAELDEFNAPLHSPQGFGYGDARNGSQRHLRQR